MIINLFKTMATGLDGKLHLNYISSASSKPKTFL